MGKALWAILLVCLILPGCGFNSEERLVSIEEKIEAVQGRLDACETRLETCENSFYVLNQKQAAVEAKKREAAVSVESMTAEDIQRALSEGGFYTGAIDGKIGPATDRAVMDFQKANGLTIDGVVGAKTKAALMGLLAPTAPAIN